MRKLSFVFVLCVGFLLGGLMTPHAFADGTAVSTGTTGIVATILAVVGVALPLFNIVMSAITQGFAVLHKLEPSWLQTVGTVGMKLSQWLTANTQTPVPASAVIVPANPSPSA